MKNIKYILLMMLSATLFFVGCEKVVDVADLTPDATPETFIAKFLDGSGEFRAEQGGPYKDGDVVNIIVPWYFPEASANETDITKMRIFSISPHSVIIDPALKTLDLSKENRISILQPNGSKIELIIRGERRKSNKANIERISIDDGNALISGIINQEEKTISFVSFGDLSLAKLSLLDLSPHATSSLNEGATFNLNSAYELTITANNGVDKSTYRLIKEMPSKLPKGIRPGSGKIMFAKKLSADLGISTINMTGGMAVTKDHIILNTRGENSVYINAFTGTKVGEINLGDAKGSLVNFYNTSDDKGNILISNLTPNNGNVFKIWKVTSVTGSPQTYIEWDAGGLALGRKFSIKGSIDGNAIITAPIHAAGGKFAKWVVVNGSLKSTTPEIVTVDYPWTLNIDIVYTSSTDVKSDYYLVGYSNNKLTRVNGVTNTISAQLDAVDGNFITNAVDYIEFNKGKYIAYNHVNSFTWGSADQAWVIDTEGNFSGNPASGTAPAVIWGPEKGKYGPNALGAAVNGNGTGDVAFRVSDDGYYLYFYYMFTNGYVVGVQFDCIDM